MKAEVHTIQRLFSLQLQYDKKNNAPHHGGAVCPTLPNRLVFIGSGGAALHCRQYVHKNQRGPHHLSHE